MVPIAVMSYNRPDYLRKVLHSLAAQKNAAMEGRPIHLFQDRDQQGAAGECVKIFRSVFPDGTVHLAHQNFGIARNFLRAETFFFRELKANCVYFFEDDLVILPHYIETMDRLRVACRTNERIGTFACYGEARASADKQKARAREIVPIAHMWGFGIFREHWELIQPELQPFYDIVLHCRYTDRPGQSIHRAMWDHGVCIDASSQDEVKKMAGVKLGKFGINTFIANGINIGKLGVHTRPISFARNGFNNQTLLNHERVDFEFPTEHELTTMMTRWLKHKMTLVQATQTKDGYGKR